MSLQCLVPSFDAPKLKYQSTLEKVNLHKALIPQQQKWNSENRYSSKVTTSNLSNRPTNSKLDKIVSEIHEGKSANSIPTIDLFDGNVQIPLPNREVRPRQHRNNVSNSRDKVVKDNAQKKPVQVNAFQRLMSTSLMSLANMDNLEEDDDDGANHTATTIDRNLSSSIKRTAVASNSISISDLLSKVSTQKASSLKAKQSSKPDTSKRKRAQEDETNLSSTVNSKSKSANISQTPAVAAIHINANSMNHPEASTTTTIAGPKAKKAKLSSTTSIALPSASNRSSRISNVGPTDDFHFQAHDFQNVQYFCRNAGSTEDFLNVFLSEVLNSDFVGMSLLWFDLSTNHVPLGKKFCTPSSHCHHWNCTCDKHIRSDYIHFHRMLGILFHIPARNASTSDACFFLPTMRCFEPVSASSGANYSGKILPLKCTTTVAQRIQVLRQILAAPSVSKILFNAQLCAIALSSITTTATSPSVVNINDPRVAVYLLNPDIDDASILDFDQLCQKYMLSRNYAAASSCEPHLIAVKGRIAEAVYHTLAELITICQLVRLLAPQLVAQKLQSVFHSLEMPLAFQLGALEAYGVRIDHSKLRLLQEQLEEQLAKVTQKIYSLSNMAQPRFNIASPEQLSHLLFQHLKLVPPTGMETASGKFISTSEETLSKIKDQHPIVEWILTFRSLFKLLHTYIEGLGPFISTSSLSNSKYSSVHASWNQLIVRTGRLSCSKPNLQNIPTNFSLSQLVAPYQEIRIRSFFTARPGYKLVAVDYSQIEMRVLAHVTLDKEMCALFRDRRGDIYKLLASKIFRKDNLAEVTGQERTRAKVICLGCIYGMGPVAAAAKLGIDVVTVSQITHSFFQHFKGVSQWIQRIRQYARQHQEVRTLSGRLRRLPEIASDIPAKRAAAERQAVNTVIQGTASDLIKSAMLLVSRAIAHWEDTHHHDYNAGNNDNDSTGDKERLRAHIIMQIHDELILEVPLSPYSSTHNSSSSNDNDKSNEAEDRYVREVVRVVRRVMEEELASRWQLKVPLLTTIRTGHHWGDMTAWTEEGDTNKNDSDNSNYKDDSHALPAASVLDVSRRSALTTNSISVNTSSSSTAGTTDDEKVNCDGVNPPVKSELQPTSTIAVKEETADNISSALSLLEEDLILSGSKFCQEVHLIDLSHAEDNNNDIDGSDAIEACILLGDDSYYAPTDICEDVGEAEYSDSDSDHSDHNDSDDNDNDRNDDDISSADDDHDDIPNNFAGDARGDEAIPHSDNHPGDYVENHPSVVSRSDGVVSSVMDVSVPAMPGQQQPLILQQQQEQQQEEQRSPSLVPTTQCQSPHQQFKSSTPAAQTLTSVRRTSTRGAPSLAAVNTLVARSHHPVNFFDTSMMDMDVDGSDSEETNENRSHENENENSIIRNSSHFSTAGEKLTLVDDARNPTHTAVSEKIEVAAALAAVASKKVTSSLSFYCAIDSDDENEYD